MWSISDIVIIQICERFILTMCIRGLSGKYPSILNTSKTGLVALM